MKRQRSQKTEFSLCKRLDGPGTFTVGDHPLAVDVIPPIQTEEIRISIGERSSGGLLEVGVLFVLADRLGRHVVVGRLREMQKSRIIADNFDPNLPKVCHELELHDVPLLHRRLGKPEDKYFWSINIFLVILRTKWMYVFFSFQEVFIKG